MSWMGLQSPPVDPSRVQDEIRSVSFIHLFLASLLPFLVPLHSSGWCSHFLKALGPPRLPIGSWYYQGQLRKEQEMEAGSQAADVRDVRPGPERAQPGCFQSQILLPCGRSSVCPSSQDRAEGQSTGSLRAQLPLGLGNITAFQCQSHFKLISLCIMFFKSFLNKTKIQSVSFHLNVGTKIRF